MNVIGNNAFLYKLKNSRIVGNCAETVIKKKRGKVVRRKCNGIVKYTDHGLMCTKCGKINPKISKR